MTSIRLLGALLAALLLAACSTTAQEAGERYDVLIQGGTVYDGSGGAP